MADLKTIRNRIEQEINAQGLTFRDISLKIGHKDSYMQQYIKYGFPRRLNEVDRKRLSHVLNIDEKDLIDDELLQDTVRHQLISDLPDSRENANDYIMINIHSQTLKDDSSNTIIGRMALNKREFSHWGWANPYELKIIRIDGDYMSPTFPSGSLILYDSSVSEFSGDGIYITNENNITQVRRIQKISDDKYIILNDNPKYQNIETTPEELHIVGKAMNYISSQKI